MSYLYLKQVGLLLLAMMAGVVLVQACRLTSRLDPSHQDIHVPRHTPLAPSPCHVVAAIADTVWEYARLRPRLDPVRFALARRLDDLAYGAGVWWASLRGRSVRALLPAIVRTERPSARQRQQG